MPRPYCQRRIAGQPGASVFKPAGTPLRELETVIMNLDEFEAMRLCELEGLYHEQAAAEMRVSRSTFSRILDSAHAKLADVVVHGKALRIEGGPVRVAGRRCCGRYGEKRCEEQPPDGQGRKK